MSCCEFYTALQVFVFWQLHVNDDGDRPMTAEHGEVLYGEAQKSTEDHTPECSPEDRKEDTISEQHAIIARWAAG